MNQLLIKKKEQLNKKKKKGFTLVELIIVIAIIAILAAMAIPKFSAIRLDSKVSNDVAAAKNIATITGTLIANDTISVSSNAVTFNVSDTSDTNAAAVRGKLDGKAGNGLGEASGKTFAVTVGKDESITVTCAGATLYPEADKTNYTAACKSGTDYTKPAAQPE